MGTIIRITGDGVFIESNLKISSMETRSSKCFNNKMCNLPSNIENVVVNSKVQQHSLMYNGTNFVAYPMTRTKSYEVNIGG